MVLSVKSQPLVLLMIVLIACTPKSNVESQSPVSQTTVMRKMPGGNCEDCELMFVGMPTRLNSMDTTTGWDDPGQKLIIKGHVYQIDKKTPAENVILYYYHTDPSGLYSPGVGDHPGARRHGHLRGWVQTGPDGSYAIYTSRPAQYPGNTIEAHIHLIVKEQDIDIPYWIDEWIFDDDPLLTSELKKRLANRGGSGILKIEKEGEFQLAEQDIILGLNISGYPGH